MEKLLTKNKKEVYVLDKALQRFDEKMFEDVKEALSKIYLNQTSLKKVVDMGRVVGQKKCVEIGPSDHVKWLYMKGKSDRIPFVFGRSGEDTSLITIVINERNGRPIIATAYYGEPAPMTHKDAAFRGLSRNYINRCYAFWNTHALIYDEALIDLKKSKEFLEGD